MCKHSARVRKICSSLAHFGAGDIFNASYLLFMRFSIQFQVFWKNFEWNGNLCLKQPCTRQLEMFTTRRRNEFISAHEMRDAHLEPPNSHRARSLATRRTRRLRGRPLPIAKRDSKLMRIFFFFATLTLFQEAAICLSRCVFNSPLDTQPVITSRV